MIIKMERNKLSKEDSITKLIKTLLITLINVTLRVCLFLFTDISEVTYKLNHL
jgi:hypothetical protein